MSFCDSVSPLKFCNDNEITQRIRITKPFIIPILFQFFIL